ncbi:MAG: class I SAM-dependent methyltransferase [Elusimicrobiota bacterium]|nr:class I SAM-dependent methyltransferase [Elusimicrobiota bacterium]
MSFDPKAFTRESAATWTDAAERYDKLSSRLFGPTAEAFVEFAGLRKGWRALELACGPGLASRAAAKLLGEKGSLLATDLAPGMIERARTTPPVKRGAPIEWKVMDAQALDLPDASFDACFSQLGLMLFAEPAKALAEMARVTEPGGPVSCLVQGRADRMELTALIMMTMVQKAPELKAPPGAPTLFSFGQEGVIETAFAKAGLTEILTRRLSGTFRFASAEEYWEVMTEGAGKTGQMLRSLSHEKQFFIKKEVIRKANRFREGGGLAIPYEFVMARGAAPARKK